MLSYQHSYHAGNFADVHKHSLLAWMLAYLTRKDKPLCYIETHAGRALYDLKSSDAQKTKEAINGISLLERHFPNDHPFIATLRKIRLDHGPETYPGSPVIAAHLLRPEDRLHLAELHPGEYRELKRAMAGSGARCHHQDGFELAQAIVPPEPRRGMLLIDPSYEIKEDYNHIPKHLAKIAKSWNVGILCLWYPILKDGRHRPMLEKLQSQHAGSLRHEVLFKPAQKNHGMIGSGMFLCNPPYGTHGAAKEISALFEKAAVPSS